MNFLDMGDMNSFVMGHWDSNFLDNCQSLLFVVMVVRDFVVDSLVMSAEIVATKVVSAEVCASEVMLVQASLVLLLAGFSFDGLFLVLCFSRRGLFFRENSHQHQGDA